MVQKNPNTYTLDLDLWPFHLDLKGEYPLGQVVSRMIHVAGEHATYYGYGIQRLMEQGATWVLSRMSIHFVHPITTELPLSITTGVIDWSGISTDRVITLEQNHQTCAIALTKWIAIDLEERAPLPIETILTDPSLRSTFSQYELPAIPRRLIENTDKALLQHRYVHRVRYSDLDINTHVNSTVWVNIAMDALPIERITNFQIQEAHLRFSREAKLGDELSVSHFSRGLMDYIQVTCQHYECFQLALLWKEN